MCRFIHKTGAVWHSWMAIAKSFTNLVSVGLECVTDSPARVGDAPATHENGNISVENLIFLPEMMASVKKLYLESVVEVAAKAHEDADACNSSIPRKKESSLHELAPRDANADLEAESDGEGESQKNSKIEPTTAEALASGLQTIKNDDLEEIRQLGSGTYGAVYHGKWKGSDVAIKRIKANCFAGRPSERERLAAVKSQILAGG